MTKRTLIPALLILVLAVVAAPALLARFRATEAAPPRTVTLRMREYAFNDINPTLQFQPGERIHFIVTNEEESNVLHNFRVVGMDVECGPPLKPGERREVTVTMPKSGEFAYTCCTHPGMGGKMVVAKK